MTGRSWHPLAHVTDNLPEWAKWMLHGILIGQPLDDDEVREHIIAADVAPELPLVPELSTMAAITMTELRLGRGCYGLAEKTIEFGRRLTLIYGENGTGKSSLARILRALAGRPSAQRPPHNMHTGEMADATLAFERDGTPDVHRLPTEESAAGLHIEVFDSADTRVDGTEYQLRPRSVLALEELRSAVDNLTISVDEVDIPSVLRATLTTNDLQALDAQDRAVDVLREWQTHVAPRSSTDVEQAFAELDDETLAQRHTDIEREGRLARADTTLFDTVRQLDLPTLVTRLNDGAPQKPDLRGVQSPSGVELATWVAFVRQALPLFEPSAEQCVLCGSEIAGRHAALVAAYRALLADEYAAAQQTADDAARAIHEAIVTHRGATEDDASSARELSAGLAEALVARDMDRLRARMHDLDALDAAARERLNRARADWQATRVLLSEAEDRRAALRRELVVAQRTEALTANPEAVAALVTAFRHRERLAAAARTQGTKQRITTALKRHTEIVLRSVYGQALDGRLAQFKVPHVALLTARHVAREGQARRQHVVGKTSTGDLFSEGEQRALALADFAAELDTRADVCHPVVIDDPVSSLDYRRLETVVEYIRDLVGQGRQVVVLTHSLWLAAALLKDVKQARDGAGPDRAWALVRTGSRLGSTARLTTSVLGRVDELEERIESVIAAAERESDPNEQHGLVTHGLGLLRAWCESFVEQKVVCGAVARLDWQVKPGKLADVDQRKIERGRRIARLYDRLHQRIDAHAQPGELMHRPDGLADLKELWDEAKRARDTSSTD